MKKKEHDIRMFEVFRMCSIVFLMVGLTLAITNIIGFNMFIGFVVIATTFFVGSMCGQLLLANQNDDQPLTHGRMNIVLVAMIATTCGCTYIHSLTIYPTQKMEIMATAEWQDDVNIEPDGMPSEARTVR